jgi:hypothetical protein
MVDADEWDWIAEHARGSFDHLIVATTLPVFMQHGIHHLEAWSEAICDGKWGSRARRIGERVRRAVDLEHWPAFQRSFERFIDLLRDVSRGRGGKPPATITILSGDVHTTYIASVDLGADAGRSRVNQIVCSPFRNPLTTRDRRVVRVTGSRAAATGFSALARACRVPAPSATWKIDARPTYDNSIGELELDERTATVTIRNTSQDDGGSPLRVAHSERLSSEPTGSAPRPVDVA